MSTPLQLRVLPQVAYDAALLRADVAQRIGVAPEQIRAIREKEDLTQAAFAIHLNISKNQVSDWERGVKKPSGTALKLLAAIAG